MVLVHFGLRMEAQARIREAKPLHARGDLLLARGDLAHPGERAELRRKKQYETGGVEIVDEIYQYFISDDIHFDRYDHKNRFAD